MPAVSWLMIYLLLMILPVLVLAFLDRAELRAVFRRRTRVARNLAAPPEPRKPHAGPLRGQPADALEATWIGIRGQYVVAPHMAIAEADELLTRLAEERGWLLPGQHASSATLGTAAKVPRGKAVSVPHSGLVPSASSDDDEIMEYFDWLVERLVLASSH